MHGDPRQRLLPQRLSSYAHLNRTRIDHTLLVEETLRDRVLRDDCLSCTRVRRHEYTLIPLYRVHRDLLERVELELVLPRGLRRRDMVFEKDIWEARGDGDFMPDL